MVRLNLLMISLVYLLQSVPGVIKIKDGFNPATWMLEVSSSAIENQLGVDFAEIYSTSDLHGYVKKDKQNIASSFSCV